VIKIQTPRNKIQIIFNYQITITKFEIWHLIFVICLMFVSCILVIPAFGAGQAGSDFAVLNAGVGARPLGMGGAFTRRGLVFSPSKK
jgi:hypothetical protein